jgi:hypothetical protein
LCGGPRYALGEQNANLVCSPSVSTRLCTVSFQDTRGVRHGVDVEADSLYEAVVLAIRRFREDPWAPRVAPATLLDVEVRAPSMRHSISLQHVERWLSGVSAKPSEASKKAKLKLILVQS